MAPKTIGRFEIIAELGQSPLGTIYKANDPKRGHVAVLALESATLTPEARQQVQQLFSRARTATLLNSPNITSVYGGGETAGYVFLSMEFVDGVTLRTAMARDSRMPTGELVDIARQLCTALDHAQSKGVAHQNLHPGNIKVEWDGAVKLMDYGLDLPGKRPAHDEAVRYAERYASPEQVRGEAITAKSNLYTLGCVLYELATGKRAIACEDAESIRDAVLNGTIEPPAKTCKEVPEIISNAIMRAMSRNPAQRFESATLLLREFESYRTPAIKPVAPVIAPTRENAVAASRPRTNYGGPNTSAIFRAMQENFRPGNPVASSAAVAEPCDGDVKEKTTISERSTVVPPVELSKPSAPTPVEQPSRRLEPVPLPFPVPNSSGLPKTQVVPNPFPASAQSKIKVPSETRNTEKPSEARAALKPKPRVNAPRGFTVPSFKFPGPKKIVPIAAGMLIAVGVLWGVGSFHSTQPQAAQSTSPAVATEALPPVVEPTAAENISEETPVSGEEQVRRRTRKRAEVAAVTPAPVLTGELVVTSVPEGAHISIDGRTEPHWLTPQLIGGVSVGSHTLTISKPGFTTVIKSVDVSANQKPVIAVAMQQVPAALAVVSEPAGAAIFLDGKDTGKLTPTQLNVVPGGHRVGLRKDGFFEYNTLVTGQSGQTMSVSAALILAGRTDQIQTVGKFGKVFGSGNSEMGKLRVKTRPKGAYILVNGKPAPDASPSEFYLNPGIYEVTLQLTGYSDVKRTVRVEKSKKIELDEVFVPR